MGKPEEIASAIAFLLSSDASFITGSAVHRNGGIPVFLASLAILSGLAWLLQRGEAWKSR